MSKLCDDLYAGYCLIEKLTNALDLPFRPVKWQPIADAWREVNALESKVRQQELEISYLEAELQLERFMLV